METLPEVNLLAPPCDVANYLGVMLLFNVYLGCSLYQTFTLQDSRQVTHP